MTELFGGSQWQLRVGLQLIVPSATHKLARVTVADVIAGELWSFAGDFAGDFAGADADLWFWQACTTLTQLPELISSCAQLSATHP